MSRDGKCRWTDPASCSGKRDPTDGVIGQAGFLGRLYGSNQSRRVATVPTRDGVHWSYEDDAPASLPKQSRFRGQYLLPPRRVHAQDGLDGRVSGV